ncbi:MAG: hypothetical protein E1N59_334 [Puniceicoccaceae bacterium 5H]|nr:MAG: hypothetical protein E1N59_334 [Puniceicoccaceae bacterium 5H]
MGWITGVISAFAVLALSAAIVQSERLRVAHVEVATLQERESQAVSLQAQLQESFNQAQREQERLARQLSGAEADLIESKARQAALQGDVAQLQRDLEATQAKLEQREETLNDRELRLARLRAELERQLQTPAAPAAAPVAVAPQAGQSPAECEVLARSRNGKVIALENAEAYFAQGETYTLQLPGGEELRFHPTRLAQDAAVGWIEPLELSSALDPGIKLSLYFTP